MTRPFRAFAVALLGVLLIAPAAAQVPEIRLARQFSMGYLQFNVMEHQELIEKHARALGLPDVKVSWLTFNGPAAVNDALLSGTVDIGAGGTPGLLLLWSKTKGTPQEVRGISAMSSQPFLLNTRNPGREDDRGFQRQGPHRAPGRESLDPGDRAADGRRQGVRPGQFRQARHSHRLDAAARRHHRAAQRRRRDHRGVQRAAVPAAAAGEARRHTRCSIPTT